jgi:hypothetical protein
MTKKERAREALAKMADELGDLEREIAEYRIKAARVEVLRAAIRAAFARADPGKPYRVDGERYVVLLGKAGNASVVDKAELLKLVGPTKFAEVASITLKSLEENCAKDVLGAVVSLEAVGPRVLTVVSRADESAESAAGA